MDPTRTTSACAPNTFRIAAVSVESFAGAAERMGVDLETASLRVFSNAEGAYGSNVNMLVDAGAWDGEDEPRPLEALPGVWLVAEPIRERRERIGYVIGIIPTARLAGDEILAALVDGYADWIRYNERTNVRKALLVTLSVLGFTDINRPTIGGMIYWANQHQAIVSGIWWWIAGPIAAIAILFLGLFMLAMSVNEYVDPRSRLDRMGGAS